MLGLLIDKLTDEEADRVICAQDWRIGGAKHSSDEGRCLLQHIVSSHRYIGKCWDRFGHTGALQAGGRFDRLCYRHGIERIVQLCKARAGKRNLSPVEAHELTMEER